jgi:hypothetical protein
VQRAGVLLAGLADQNCTWPDLFHHAERKELHAFHDKAIIMCGL